MKHFGDDNFGRAETLNENRLRKTTKLLGEALKMCMSHKSFGTTFNFKQCQEALKIYQNL